MKLTAPKLYQWLGWNTQGDIGPWTCYTARDKGLVIFLTTTPKVPASPAQLRQRAKFGHVAWLWHQLDPSARDAWMSIGLRARLRVTGFNLWTYFLLTGDRAAIRTLELNTGIKLEVPPYSIR
jgi:hypothetical protein